MVSGGCRHFQHVAGVRRRLFGSALGGGLIGIWIAMACDECLRGLLFTIRFRRGKWKEKRLVTGTAEAAAPADLPQQ